MSDIPGSSDDGNVLRPFEEATPDPLPPVEPSKIVPEDQAPKTPVPDAPVAESVVPEAAVAEPVVSDVPVKPTAAGLVEAWSPEGSDEDDLEGDGPAPVTPRPRRVSPAGDTVTLPRQPFLIGVSVMVVAMIILIALWQSSGGDGPVPALDPGLDAAEPQVVADEGDPAPVEPAVDPALEAEIETLNAAIDALTDELAAQPAPPLPGTSMHRIPVIAGSKFVSATDASVAVVSPFGSYANIDPATNTVTASGTVAGGATRVMRTSSTVWVTNYSDNQLVRIDPSTNSVSAVFDFPGPDGLAKFGDQLLVASYDGEFVGKVAPGTGEIVERLDLGGKPTAVLVTEEHGIWVALFDTGEVLQIDADQMTVVGRLLVGAGPVGLADSANGIWVANNNEGTVALIDPGSATVVETIEVGEGPTGLVDHAGQLWVTVTDAGTLVQIDQATFEIITRTPLGGSDIAGGPVGISRSAGSLWIAMDREDSLVRITLPE